MSKVSIKIFKTIGLLWGISSMALAKPVVFAEEGAWPLWLQLNEALFILLALGVTVYLIGRIIYDIWTDRA